MNDLVALILAGGEGSRFWPLCTNKIIFPFAGKPLFDRTIRDVLPKEVNRAVIVTNRSNKEYFSAVSLPIPHVTVLQREARGMADAVLAAEPEISGKRLLIMIADDLAEKSLFKDIMKKASGRGVFGVIAGKYTESYFPGGYIKLEKDRALGIVEKPQRGFEPSRYVTITGHYVSDAALFLQEIKRIASDSDDAYEQALSRLMKYQTFMHVPYSGRWSTLKYPWHVLDVASDILADLSPIRGKKTEIHETALLSGPVYIEDGVRIYEHAKITGPCFIGEGTIVGNNTLIRESIIGRNCVIGFSSDITRSYIGDRCWFHTNYVGDSVVEGNVSMGSGAVTANLRLDEGEIRSRVRGGIVSSERCKFGSIIAKDVRIGVNASIMPGVKIGQNTFIGAGVILEKDVPDNTFCMLKQDMEMKSNTKLLQEKTRDDFKHKLPSV